MICLPKLRIERCLLRIGRPVTLILASLLLTTGEATACPYHTSGSPHRFGPFDALGGWRESLDTLNAPPFETGPTATQMRDASQDQQNIDGKPASKQGLERQE